MPRHFPYKHPTFGTKTKPKNEQAWKSSVYYWWWEYLRRNEDYKRTCDDGGIGKCADLYEDFGNVFTADFKTWWSEGGRAVHLFAEPEKPSVRILKDGVVVDTSTSNSLVLDIPLSLPITFISQTFNRILAKHHQGKRGIRANLSTQAKYKVHGKVAVVFLNEALLVWDYRQKNPDLPLWRIAQDTKIVPSKHWVRDDDPPSTSVAKRNLLTATASRHYKKAANMIANVGKGKFPVATAKSD